MEMVKIGTRNFMFSEPWGGGEPYDLNIGLILGNVHNFLIDTGRGSGSVAPVVDFLAGDEKPLIVVNTHADWDHHWGNHVFADCAIIAHESCREILAECWEEQFERLQDKADGEVVKCLPNVTFTDRMDFHEDGVSLIYTPGHTPTCISVYDSVDKVLYAGDNIGDTDDAIIPEIHTDKATFSRLIETYRQFDFEICISGHNKPQGKEVVEKMAKALELS
ncbi:MAG: MBL fold metallo-hydrolase [Defluviitaleaceae bacterium]|nr:MBL fold metallo-hydrolase [Defluviitaleaceae bacterium]